MLAVSLLAFLTCFAVGRYLLCQHGWFSILPPHADRSNRRSQSLAWHLTYSMIIDFTIRSCTRRCAESGRALAAGEPYYSILVEEENDVIRRDIAAEAWQGPPEDHLGWWRARLADRNGGKPKLAPGEVLISLFERWAKDPQQADARYVLALLLIRRRMLRIEEAGFAVGLHGEEADQGGATDTLKLYCPQNDKSYEVACVKPSTEQIASIQKRLSELLFADAA